METDTRNLKVALALDRIRGPDEAALVKELWAALVAYNLATQARRVTAARLKMDPRRLSFAGVLSLVRAFMPGLHAGMNGARYQKPVRATGTGGRSTEAAEL